MMAEVFPTLAFGACGGLADSVKTLRLFGSRHSWMMSVMVGWRSQVYQQVQWFNSARCID
jgi:hypothetical protein